MNLRFINRYRLQNDDAGYDGGGGDAPLGEKGQKALEAEKQKARELAKKARELEEKLKAFEGLDLNAVQEALKFQSEAALREAEAKANTEEARKIEREQAAAEKKRLQAEKDMALGEREKALAMLSDTHLNTAILLGVNDAAVDKEDVRALTKIISSDHDLRKQLAYLTKRNDGVESDGVYVVDKSGDPVFDKDDRNKYLSITDWINTTVRSEYPKLFLSRNPAGDGLKGSKGKRGTGISTEALASMNPTQRAEWARANGAK